MDFDKVFVVVQWKVQNKIRLQVSADTGIGRILKKDPEFVQTESVFS